MTVFHGHVMTLHILTLAHMLIKIDRHDPTEVNGAN